jgi:2-C-methyl-D-erythritol 2,4-cyclodiphosphate synthase
MIRVGAGHDSHRLVAGRPLILGGVRIDHWRGLEGHSDGDVVLHAVTDALLSAASLGDIGDHFPNTDPANKEADSTRFLHHAVQLLTGRGWRIGNVALTIFAEEPTLGPTKAAIRTNLARLLGINDDAVNVQAKTGEGVGPIGRGEAMACSAVVLIEQ